MALLDWFLCIGVVVALFSQGWWFARAQKTTEDYFVGGRRMNWLAVGLSMFATTFSPLSFVGLPREAAYGNYHLYLAILFIPLFVVPLVSWLFIPLYYPLRMTSAYEYLERRFDWRLRRCGSLLFGLYTLGWMGSMLYATGLVVQAALGLGERQMLATLIVLGTVATVYTTLGGFQAAVWTNVVKAAILAGLIVTILCLAVARVDGGLASVLRLGWEHNKFAMFDMHFDMTRGASFYGACSYGMFVYFATAVTGQAAVQRYASMPSVSAARRSLAVHGTGTACVCLLFFLLGTTLFAFYQQHPATDAAPGSVFPPLAKQDHLTTWFVRHELHYPGLLGLMLAGLFATVMGSISSGLNALSSLVVYDWLQGQSPGVRASRVMSLLFGMIAVGTALLVPHLGEHVFDILIRIAGACFGPLLGLFLLGALVRRANVPGASLGLLAGVTCLALVFPTNVAHWYYGACTCLPTLIVGTLASLLYPAPAPEQTRGLVCTGRSEALVAAPEILPAQN